MNKKEKSLQADLPKGFQNQWGNPLLLKKELLKIIEKNFIKFGYSPLESSLMQLSSIIGNSLSEDEENPMSDIYTYSDDGVDVSLRYDLSQPLINFYKQNYKNLPNPYKRYEMGNVFRREKPGSSRYRSFGQCDVDIIGNFDVKQANADLCSIIGSILTEIINKSEFVINVSNRKIVQGLIEDLKIEKEKQIKVMRAIDKLDKPGFGLKGVEELLKKERKDKSGAITKGANLSDVQASKILNFLKIKDLKELKENFKNPVTQEGIKELEELFEVLNFGNYSDQVKTNFTIVRGLDYYDGFCVETNLNFKAKNIKGKEVDIGSICSGGQYNKLISRFKGVDIPGTGVSIGVDRLLFAMMQLNQIEVDTQNPVIVCVMDEKYLKNYYEILDNLRKNNINSEIFLDSKKNLGKQLTYANKRECPVAVICGENEFKDNKITLKNLLGAKGENNQITFPKENLINEIKKFI